MRLRQWLAAMFGEAWFRQPSRDSVTAKMEVCRRHFLQANAARATVLQGPLLAQSGVVLESESVCTRVIGPGFPGKRDAVTTIKVGVSQQPVIKIRVPKIRMDLNPYPADAPHGTG
jgi:hypothetical protein